MCFELVRVVVTPQKEACTPPTRIAEDEALALMQNQLFSKHSLKKATLD